MDLQYFFRYAKSFILSPTITLLFIWLWMLRNSELMTIRSGLSIIGRFTSPSSRGSTKYWKSLRVIICLKVEYIAWPWPFTRSFDRPWDSSLLLLSDNPQLSIRSKNSWSLLYVTLRLPVITSSFWNCCISGSRKSPPNSISLKALSERPRDSISLCFLF